MRTLNKITATVPENVFRTVAKNPCSFRARIERQITGLLRRQDTDDPKNFIPHNKNHSESVYQYAKSIYERFSNNFKTRLSNILEIDQELIQLIIYLSCILHDCGYPNQMEKGLQKCNHTIESAAQFKQEVKPSLLNLLEQNGIDLKKRLWVADHIQDIILYHGADKREAFFNFQLESEVGNLVAQSVPIVTPQMYGHVRARKLSTPCEGRFADLFTYHDNHIGIPYFKVDFSDPNTFFHALIRLSDNMDSTRYRLHVHQQSVIKKIFDAFNRVNLQPCHLELLDLPSISLVSTEESDFYNLLRENKDQRKYFLGIYLLENIDASYDNDSETLHCHYTYGDYEVLGRHIYVDHEFINGETIPLSDFFITRLKESVQSIRCNNTPIQFIEKHIIQN